MPISDEAAKSHRDSITHLKSQWLNWIQTQAVCLPALSEVGMRDTGSHCPLTDPLGNPGKRGKWPARYFQS